MPKCCHPLEVMVPIFFFKSFNLLVLLMLFLQIRFDSFTAPLLLLGCFAKGVDCFPSVPAPSHGLTLNSSGSFTSFESEFRTWQPPSEKIDENSFVFAAAEILRFLRDMALDISTAQSKSLLQIQHKHKNSSASPPTTAAALLCSTPPPIWCTPVLSYAC